MGAIGGRNAKNVSVEAYDRTVVSVVLRTVVLHCTCRYRKTIGPTIIRYRYLGTGSSTYVPSTGTSLTTSYSSTY